MERGENACRLLGTIPYGKGTLDKVAFPFSFTPRMLHSILQPPLVKPSTANVSIGFSLQKCK